MLKAMYLVMYWDAYGAAHNTDPMDKAAAEAFASSMLPRQEARTVLVYVAA